MINSQMNLRSTSETSPAHNPADRQSGSTRGALFPVLQNGQNHHRHINQGWLQIRRGFISTPTMEPYRLTMGHGRSPSRTGTRCTLCQRIARQIHGRQNLPRLATKKRHGVNPILQPLFGRPCIRMDALAAFLPSKTQGKGACQSPDFPAELTALVCYRFFNVFHYFGRCFEAKMERAMGIERNEPSLILLCFRYVFATNQAT